VGVVIAFTVPADALEPSALPGATVWAAIATVGDAMVPLLLIALGASLVPSAGPASGEPGEAPAAAQGGQDEDVSRASFHAGGAGMATDVLVPAPPGAAVHSGAHAGAAHHGPPARDPTRPRAGGSPAGDDEQRAGPGVQGFSSAAGPAPWAPSGPSLVASPELIALVCVLRLFVVPLVVIPIVYALASARVIPPLPRVTAVVMLEACPPSAAQLMIMVILNAQRAERAASQLLFGVNVAALPVLMLWIVVVLVALQSLYGLEPHESS